jgi:hypothetical protein
VQGDGDRDAERGRGGAVTHYCDRTYRPSLVLKLEDLLLYAEGRVKLCEPGERDHWIVVKMGLARAIESIQSRTREAQGAMADRRLGR